MKIHVVESMALDREQKARLAKLGEVKYFEGVPSVDELLERVEGADVVCCDWAPIDAAIPKMKRGSKLVSLPFTGVGFLPLKEASAKGIKIANAPGAFTESAGEFGVGLMLALMRKICVYARDEPKPELAASPHGKTIVILGAGRIGGYVGKLAGALGMRVVFWKRGDGLEKILKEADVVYCALPLSDDTKGLLGGKEFAAMKRGAYFVTTSHHEIYDDAALLKALDDNLAGAAMDLEGINCGDYESTTWRKMKSHPKILVTPHVAFKSDYG
ncbi:MAG: 2-hydroxyacid dehydrogenase [Candidatus Micrarchaeia archaeon]